MSLRCYH